MVKNTTDLAFEHDVIEASKKHPIVVDFWASWCGPCMVLGPVLEKVAKDYEGRATIVKINVEENQKKASEYSVMSIPSVKLFKDGKVVDEFVGAQPEGKIRAWLDHHL